MPLARREVEAVDGAYGGSSSWRGRIWIALVVLGLMAIVVSGTASATTSAPQAVSRISLMPIGTFSFDAGGSESFGGSIACSDQTGCLGVFGFNFPNFNPLGQVSGSYACSPSESPSSCAISVTSGDLFSCVLTVYLPAQPDLSNAVDVVCSNPAGHGHGITTLTILN